MACATVSPNATPSSLADPFGIDASDVASVAARAACCEGNSRTSTPCAALAAAASAEASAGGFFSRKYGLYSRSIAFIASKIAMWTMASVRWIAGPPLVTTCWFHAVTTSARAVLAARTLTAARITIVFSIRHDDVICTTS
jgi:hypothetical protein